MNLTEAVALAVAGDPRAVADLYGEYKNSVYYLCLKLTGNNEDAAAGLLQSTFMHAFHKLSLLKNPEDFHSWILVTAAKRCKTYLSEKNPIIFLQSASDDNKSDSKKFPYGNTENTVSRAAEIPAVRTFFDGAIDVLPDAEKFSVMLFFYCGMTVDQISRCMQTSVERVKSNILSGVTIIERNVDSKKDSIPALAAYTGIGELGAILEYVSRFCDIPEQVSDTIIAAGMSLIRSAANRRANEIISDTAMSINTPTNQVKGSVIWKALITVLLMLILTSIIITATVYLPKIVGLNDPVEPDDDTTDWNVTGTVSDSDTDIDTDTDTDTSYIESDSQTDNVTANTDEITTKPVEDKTDGVTTSSGTPVPVVKDYKYKNNGDGTVSITGYTGKDAYISLPSYIDDLPVTTIADGAFQKNATLTRVIIPDTVKHIGTYAFLECSSLAQIDIPLSVKTVGGTAFGKTPWLDAQKDTFVTVGDGVLIKVNSKKATLEVPEGVKYIANVFYYIGTVKEIKLPSTVTGIGDFAFAVCIELKTINLPSSIISMNANAIYECKALTSIKTDSGSYAETWCNTHGYAQLVVH